jgi:hypothetical protein
LVEWRGTNSFNTSQGAGVNLNFSVFIAVNSLAERLWVRPPRQYSNLDHLPDWKPVDIVDNQGSRYSGSVGAPGLVALPDGTIPAGAEFVQSQISFTGKDGVSARDIEFVGIIHAISVTDIQGNSTEKVDVSGSGSGSTNFNNSGSSSGSRTETTRTFAQGTNIVQETVLTIGTPADAFYDVTVTTVTFDAASGQEISRNVTTTRNQGSGSGNSSSSGSTSTTTTFTDFQITEANTQYRLEGTWIEQGGVTSGVKARSPGSSGTIQTTSTETAPAP